MAKKRKKGTIFSHFRKHVKKHCYQTKPKNWACQQQYLICALVRSNTTN